jgi:Domain of unknown function (DUF929)
MSKRSRLQHRQQRQAELARRAELARKRRRLTWAGAAVAVVLVIVGALVVVKLTAGSTPAPAEAAGSSPGTDEVQQAIANVPPEVLGQVGLGAVDTLPKAMSGQPALTSDGKPLIVYIGAEYCPYCAAQRWGMAVALSRFGTFTGLGETKSSSIDAFPNTATLSFHGATYTSQYIVFQGVETTTNVRQGDGYAPLDTPTAAQNQLMTTYDAPPYVDSSSAGAIPFLDIANKYVMAGASYNPGVLAGKGGIDIADLLSTPDDPIAKAIDGSANAFTAAICEATGGQPGNVCTASGVTAYQAKLHG